MKITPEELLEIIEASAKPAAMAPSYSVREVAGMICEIGRGTTNKIAAIKLLRALYGLSLKESKDMVDAAWWQPLS